MQTLLTPRMGGALPALLAVALATPAYSATRHVEPAGSDVNNDCLDPAIPCATIARALSVAADLDIISLAAATFTEFNLVVDKKVTLRGQGKGVTIVQASAQPDENPNRIFKTTTSTVVFEDFTIRHGGRRVITGSFTGGPAHGGGIENFGYLRLLGVRVSKNRTAEGLNFSGGHGGGIYNDAGATLELDGCEIDNNETGGRQSASGSGGGIYNAGALLATHSTLWGNRSSAAPTGSGFKGGDGAGLYNVGTATVTASTIHSNVAGTSRGQTAGGSGGGIFNSGFLYVESSRIVLNEAGGNDTHLNGTGGSGGGVANYWNGLVPPNRARLVNSIVSENRSRLGGHGGGIANFAFISLEHSTVAGNHSTTVDDPFAAVTVMAAGGGIYSAPLVPNFPFSVPAFTVLSHTLVADNTVEGTISQPGIGPDCGGPLRLSPYNFIRDVQDCNPVFDAGDTTNLLPASPIDAHLLVLPDLNGAAFTVSLLPQSPALDAGDPNYAGTLTTDQSGHPRVIGSAIDIGAVELNQAPIAVDDAFSLSEDDQLDVPESTVLDNVSDPEGHSIQIVSVSGTESGSETSSLVSWVRGQSITFSPGAQLASLNTGETITYAHFYTVQDALGAQSVGQIEFTVHGQNDAPVARSESLTLFEGQTQTILDSGERLLTDNDADAEFQTLTVETVPVVDVQNGILSLFPNGAFSYIHDGSENLSDSFRYRVLDSEGLGAEADVTIQVQAINDPPDVRDDRFRVTASTPLILASADGPLRNDSDPEGDSLTLLHLDTAQTQGTVTWDFQHSFRYDPDGKFSSIVLGQSATDRFSYTLSDGQGAEATAFVEIEVLGQNDLPIAVEDAFTVLEGQTQTVLDSESVSLLANDQDPDDGSILQVETSLIVSPTHGTLQLSANGSFSYTHDGTENHGDQFRYRVRDEHGAISEADVTVTVTPVNDPPVAQDDLFQVMEKAFLDLMPGEGPLQNDTDSEQQAIDLESLDNAQTLGQVTWAPGQNFRYEPGSSFVALALGQSATDGFSYTIRDAQGGKSSASVQIEVLGQNDAPTALGESLTVLEGQTQTVLDSGSNDLRANDQDPDTGSVLSIETFPVVAPEHGTLSLSPEGRFSYVHDGSENHQDQFRYRVRDEHGETSEADVTITVTPLDDPPVAHDDHFELAQNGRLELSPETGPLLNDADMDSSQLSFVILEEPSAGVLMVTPEGGLVWTPPPDTAGEFSFRYAVSDGTSQSAPATVTMVVTAPTDDTAPGTTPDCSKVPNDPSCSAAGGDGEPATPSEQEAEERRERRRLSDDAGNQGCRCGPSPSTLSWFGWALLPLCLLVRSRGRPISTAETDRTAVRVVGA